jgi:hypothetical protein
VLAAPVGAGEAGVRRPQLAVRETAGIRRFGHPVTAVLPPVAAARAGDRFRLLENGKPVAAQFRRVEHGRGGPAVYLDFNVSHGPPARPSEALVVCDEPVLGLALRHPGFACAASHTRCAAEGPVYPGRPCPSLAGCPNEVAPGPGAGLARKLQGCRAAGARQRPPTG